MEKTPTPEIKTKVRIELGFNLQTNQLTMTAGGTPAVVVYGVLRLMAAAKPKEIPETAPGAARRVTIEYDLTKDIGYVESDASAVLHAGIIALAEASIGQNQIMKRLEASNARKAIMAPEVPAGHMRLGDIPLGGRRG